MMDGVQPNLRICPAFSYSTSYTVLSATRNSRGYLRETPAATPAASAFRGKRVHNPLLSTVKPSLTVRSLVVPFL